LFVVHEGILAFLGGIGVFIAMVIIDS
jgi:hypothetical protein